MGGLCRAWDGLQKAKDASAKQAAPAQQPTVDLPEISNAKLRDRMAWCEVNFPDQFDAMPVVRTHRQYRRAKRSGAEAILVRGMGNVAHPMVR